jgi:hypothetical protein
MKAPKPEVRPPIPPRRRSDVNVLTSTLFTLAFVVAATFEKFAAIWRQFAAFA